MTSDDPRGSTSPDLPRESTISDLPRVFDGHNDTLLALHDPGRGEGRSFFEESDVGHLDLPRAHEGNLGGGIFATFVLYEEAHEPRETDTGHEVPPYPAIDPDRSRRETHAMVDLLHDLEVDSDGDLRVVRTADDLRRAFESDAIAAVAHLEGAEAVRPDCSNLADLFERGVRSIGLVWSRPNAFGHGVPFRFPGTPDVGPGLTDAGRDLVRACNDRGILVDLAHLNERGYWDVADISDDPLVVSHAGVHELCPSSRNLTDEQLEAVADSGGLVGITFAVTSLRPDGENDTDTPISTLVDHVEYVAERVGVEHVALGSDFDGATVPDSVGDVTGLPDVFEELRDRGFGDRDLRKIAHENWFRVIEETWVE